jgi:hypothetical protein
MADAAVQHLVKVLPSCAPRPPTPLANFCDSCQSLLFRLCFPPPLPLPIGSGRALQLTNMPQLSLHMAILIGYLRKFLYSFKITGC